VKVSEFDFELPEALIAQTPAPERGTSRLLVLHRETGAIEHTDVSQLPQFLSSGDLIVVNDTKVFPARLLGTRVPSGGAVECLLLGRLGADRWDALVHPGQKLRPGERVVFPDGRELLHGEILERRFHGRRTVRLWSDGDRDLDRIIDEIGHVPLPPYIKRPDEPADRDRYQTIYARERGSIAAPTAGLHLTDRILAELDRKGVERAAVTLHVGYGTFQPVRVADVEAHTVEPERFSIDERTASRIQDAKRHGRRVLAVGTTTTRALESAARVGGGVLGAHSGFANAFIYPGFEFQVITALMTNFHLPRSSLLMLVAAFAGRDRILSAYRDAISRGYKFYSFGDAMLIL
jgi:S-adenosylmethionine:tRNA ribosyltransferase-isomerase